MLTDLSKIHEELRKQSIKLKIEMGENSPMVFVTESRVDGGYIGYYTMSDIEAALSDIPSLAAKLEQKRKDERCQNAIDVLTANGYSVTAPADDLRREAID